jgi:hypothetical protein
MSSYFQPNNLRVLLVEDNGGDAMLFSGPSKS